VDGKKFLTDAAYRKATLEKEQEVVAETSKYLIFYENQKLDMDPGSPDSKRHMKTQKSGQTIDLSQNELDAASKSPKAVEFATRGEIGTSTIEQKGDGSKDSKIECEPKHTELIDNKELSNLISQKSSTEPLRKV